MKREYIDDQEFYITLTYKECISAPMYVAEHILLDKSNHAYSAAFQWGPLIVSELAARQGIKFADTLLGAYEQRIKDESINPIMKYLIIMGACYEAMRDKNMPTEDVCRLLSDLSPYIKFNPNSKDRGFPPKFRILDEKAFDHYNETMRAVKTRTGVITPLFKTPSVSFRDGSDEALVDLLCKYPFHIIEAAKSLTADGHYQDGRLSTDVDKLSLDNKHSPAVHYYMIAWYQSEMMTIADPGKLSLESIMCSSADRYSRNLSSTLTDRFTIAYECLNDSYKKAAAFESIMNSLAEMANGTIELDSKEQFKDKIMEIFKENKDLM